MAEWSSPIAAAGVPCDESAPMSIGLRLRPVPRSNQGLAANPAPGRSAMREPRLSTRLPAPEEETRGPVSERPILVDERCPGYPERRGHTLRPRPLAPNGTP